MSRTALSSLAAGLGFIAAVAASSANAADIPYPVKARPAPVPVYYNWTGVYVGGHFGYGWGRFSGLDPSTGATDSVTAKGIFGGGQIGTNYQVGSWVFGLEGTFSLGDIKYRQEFGGGDFAQIKVDQMATIAGRIGYAFDRTLFYGKFGGAWTREKWDFAVLGGTANATVNRTGWVAGGGVEYAFAKDWSLFLEYDYRKMSNKTVTLATTGGITAAGSPSVALNVQTVKAGVNWRFWGPY
jgi:outer membrane immunogenic protein